MTNTIEITKDFTVAQIATAWRLARAYHHTWGYVPLDDISKCNTISEIFYLTRNHGRGDSLDVLAPSISGDVLVHRTFSKRLSWSVDVDGHATIALYSSVEYRDKPVLSVTLIACETAEETGIPQYYGLANVINAANNLPRRYDAENDEYLDDDEYCIDPEDESNNSIARLKADARFHRRHIEALKQLLIELNEEIADYQTLKILFQCARPDGYIVSRHPAAIDFIRDSKPDTKSFPIRESISAEEARGCDLFGNVPLSIAAAAKSITSIEFKTAPRGVELSYEEMVAAGAKLKTFTVKPA